ncbi:hypothetical protein OAS39_08025, partial [Pirellulales bacterium]|nr:hypothetical protein [Pirellulales bacterium]
SDALSGHSHFWSFSRKIRLLRTLNLGGFAWCMTIAKLRLNRPALPHLADEGVSRHVPRPVR